MYFGVQYYPEHWPEERWEIDAKMMQEAGVTHVRMGEFAWSRYEAVPGEYDFSWLKRAIFLLYKHGISTLLCTVSRTPPPWVYTRYPGVVTTHRDGQQHYGHRYYVGHGHAEFQQIAQEIDTKVIDYFAGMEGIMGWQIDNEIGAQNDCFCNQCLHGFRRFLQEKYETVDALNQAWGQHFWSFRFNCFEEVQLPHTNPQVGIEYRRYMSKLNNDFNRWRCEYIRRKDPDALITTNFQSVGAQHTDYYEQAKDLNLNGMNYYPKRTRPLGLDLYKGQRKEFIVLEQETRLQPFDVYEGQMRMNAYRAIAHGASGINFFRWRVSPIGQEFYADGIIHHDGLENRKYRELKKMGVEIAQIKDDIDRCKPQADIAILVDYQSRWLEAELSKKIKDKGRIMKLATQVHEAFSARGLNTDVFDPKDDFSSYKVIVFPSIGITNERLGKRICQYAENGGTVVLTPGCFLFDENGKCLQTVKPAFLHEAAGIRVTDHVESAHIPDFKLKGTGLASLSGHKGMHPMSEIELLGADVLAEHDFFPRRGMPAVTVNTCGKGKIYYIGVSFDQAGMKSVIDHILDNAGMPAFFDLPEGVWVRSRSCDEFDLIFFINENFEPVELDLPAGDWSDAFSGEKLTRVETGPVDVRILKLKKA